MNGSRTVLDCIMHKVPSTRKNYRVSLIVPDNGIPIIEYYQAHQRNSKKPKKSIQFVDLLFADKKHDTNEKFAFSIYATDKTTTFLAQDEASMNEWLTKIREYHSNLYPEFKRYDSIFEANLLDRGLAKTMNIQGQYRLALCRESLDLIPLLTTASSNNNLLTKQQQQTNPITSTFKTPISIRSSHPHSQQHHETELPDHHLHHHQAFHYNPHQSHHDHHHVPHHHHHHHHHHHSSINNTLHTTSITPHLNHPHLPQHLPSHQRFGKRHPLLMSKTIELVIRSIRRCGHTDSNFYIESGRHSQIGQGDLWMALKNKPTARQLHELLLATMKLASTTDDQFLYKAPRSRSGSSSENHRTQQSRSSSLVCLNGGVELSQPLPIPTGNNIDEDSGYLPMA